METKTKVRIERGKDLTKLIVPHENTVVTFVYPPIGPSNYRKVGEEILNKEYRIPTGDETASLLHAAYFSDVRDELEFDNIRRIMDNINNCVWIYNRSLWTDKGVYIVQDQGARGRSENFNENELEKMLKNGENINGVRFSKDKIVRFAPKETYTSEIHMKPEKLSKDGYITASYGQDGAKKLGEFVAHYQYHPVVFEPKSEDDEYNLRVSELVVASCFIIIGTFGNGETGYSFAVLK